MKIEKCDVEPRGGGRKWMTWIGRNWCQQTPSSGNVGEMANWNHETKSRNGTERDNVVRSERVCEWVLPCLLDFIRFELRNSRRNSGTSLFTYLHLRATAPRTPGLPKTSHSVSLSHTYNVNCMTPAAAYTFGFPFYSSNYVFKLFNFINFSIFRYFFTYTLPQFNPILPSAARLPSLLRWKILKPRLLWLISFYNLNRIFYILIL